MLPSDWDMSSSQHFLWPRLVAALSKHLPNACLWLDMHYLRRMRTQTLVPKVAIQMQ